MAKRIKKAPLLKTLSGYTIAGNCTDITDCKDGIDELIEYMDYCYSINAKVPTTAYKRYNKLVEKLKKFENKKKK